MLDLGRPLKGDPISNLMKYDEAIGYVLFDHSYVALLHIILFQESVEAEDSDPKTPLRRIQYKKYHKPWIEA